MEHSKIKNFRVFLFTTQKNNQNIIKYVDRLHKKVYNIIIKIIKGNATPYKKENRNHERNTTSRNTRLRR